MEGCVEWTGMRDKRGYGRRRYKGLPGYLAHRAAWEDVHGAIPDQLTIDHLCFNPGCVSVEHMRLLTLSENSANQQSAVKMHCKNRHEFTPENTYQRKQDGRRDCRACIRDRKRKQRSAAA